VSKQRLSLFGSRKERNAVDPRLYEALLRGEASLKDALGVSQLTLDELRAQTRALYHAGKWARAIELVFALDALGELEPFDALIVSRCFDELGDAQNAEASARVAEGLLAQLETLLEENKTS
jgi:hypothetical protein